MGRLSLAQLLMRDVPGKGTAEDGIANMKPQRLNLGINLSKIRNDPFIRRSLQDANRSDNLQSARSGSLSPVSFIYHQRRLEFECKANCRDFAFVQVSQRKQLPRRS